MNKEIVSSFISILGTLTLTGQILLFFIILLLVSSVFKKKSLRGSIKFLSENAISFAFLIAIIATVGSLFLSEIAHFVPCKLCWFQRIFMYPQVLILGIAAFKNDFAVKKYIIPLSLIGLVIASYHYILQMSPIPLPCTDEIASCAAKQFASFGYITIPLMAWTAFALILVLMIFINKGKSRG